MRIILFVPKPHNCILYTQIRIFDKGYFKKSFFSSWIFFYFRSNRAS